MQFEARFDIFALFMLLGISQGIFLIYYYLNKQNRQEPANLYLGLFLVACIILSSEILLNYSGLIVKVIRIENYSEPFIFLPMPFVYLFIKARLKEKFTREDYIHFFPFILYFVYCFLYFMQSPEFKYNSYVYCYKPDWDTLAVNMRLLEDPLGLRESLATLYISQALVYLYLIFLKVKYAQTEGDFAFFGRKDRKIAQIFNIWIHAVVVVGLVIFIKINFERDLGDYLIGTYISLILYINGFLVVSRQINPHQDVGKEEIPRPKYEKSPLSDEKKTEILSRITIMLEQEKYFSKNTLSLADLAKAVNEPPHYVSQVINEKLDKNFFDLLSGYRISEAKKLLHEKAGDQITIEEIAEKVGYNSKAAFNKAFKTITGVTPSEFRKNR